jgi:hypothetical protein
MPCIDHSKHVSPSMEPSPQCFGLPTSIPHRHRRKEEDPHLHTIDITRAKLERLRLAKLTRRDHKDYDLDMPRFKESIDT